MHGDSRFLSLVGLFICFMSLLSYLCLSSCSSSLILLGRCNGRGEVLPSISPSAIWHHLGWDAPSPFGEGLHGVGCLCIFLSLVGLLICWISLLSCLSLYCSLSSISSSLIRLCLYNGGGEVLPSNFLSDILSV